MPGDHEQAENLGKLGDDVLCDPVAEILLLGIATHVLEGQLSLSDGLCPLWVKSEH